MQLHPIPDDTALAESARNLLCTCGGFAPGDAVVICSEGARHGWYDGAVAAAVAREAEELGLRVTLCEAAPPDCDQPPALSEAMRRGAHIVYFARIGDHDRFGPAIPGARRVMVYARTADDLASPFGRTDYAAMMALKRAVDTVIFAARKIEIGCPQGTDISGAVPPGHGAVQDVTIRRFPLGVPAPVPADGFSGRVALCRALTPTGNRAYDPAVLPLAQTAFADVTAGRITGFHGPSKEVAAIEAHYCAVAEKFGLDPWVVHSWHAGLHPGCRFFTDDGANPDYWSNTVFSSPRLLHFHTCGSIAPGEISWNIVDPTVLVDGRPLWLDGTLQPDGFGAICDCIARHKALSALF
ncbi:MAG: hypothetical protein ACWA5A_11055 [Marinibacterium sp.]